MYSSMHKRNESSIFKLQLDVNWVQRISEEEITVEGISLRSVQDCLRPSSEVPTHKSVSFVTDNVGDWKSNFEPSHVRMYELVRHLFSSGPENILGVCLCSLCPMIWGRTLEKFGLLLSLFSGAEELDSSDNCANGAENARQNIHVLLAGDPGLGKSQLLRAVASVAPKSTAVCGNAATVAGLTVSMGKDINRGDAAFDAGALVLGDMVSVRISPSRNDFVIQGVCCIDELDKMNSSHSALLECMEQQRISVAKSGMLVTVPARTIVIAAANPVGGHYNNAKTVRQYLLMLLFLFES